MQDWKDVRLDEITQIECVVAMFEVWSITTFPFGKVKIKLLENQQGHSTGVPNMAARSKQDGTADWVSGWGTSIPEALKDTIEQLLRSIAEQEAVAEEDVVWAEPEDF